MYLADAVYYERKELIEYLLTYPNIDVNYISDNFDGILLYHTSILYIIVHSRSISIPILILKLFLNCEDFNVNIQGYTGLHDACRLGREECVKELLLDARVDIMIRNSNGRMARDIAIYWRHFGIAKIINNSRHHSNDN